MKRCIVSYADTPHYQSKMKRLDESLKGRFDGDFISFTHHSQIGSPSHKEVPYAFKPYAIQKAINLGYETILWLDSPIHAIKDLSPVFEYIEQHGFMFFDNIGHTLGMWTNDKCLEYFNIPREQAMKIQMIMACAIGINIQNILAVNFFNLYRHLIDLYPGPHSNHRHDQSVASCLIYRQGLDIITAHETFFMYESFRNVFNISETVCLVSS